MTEKQKLENNLIEAALAYLRADADADQIDIEISLVPPVETYETFPDGASRNHQRTVKTFHVNGPDRPERVRLEREYIEKLCARAAAA